MKGTASCVDPFYACDERGSVVYLTNAAGHVVQRYRYDAFGRGDKNKKNNEGSGMWILGFMEL